MSRLRVIVIGIFVAALIVFIVVVRLNSSLPDTSHQPQQPLPSASPSR